MTQPPSKKELMLALLERAEAQVHLDARRPAVQLPARLLGQAHLRLDYGYGFTPPIPDLVIDDEGIRATLSFNRTPMATFVPWSAVFLIADFDGNGAVWQEDVPTELLSEATPVATKGPPGATPTGPRAPLPATASAATASAATSATPPAPPAPRRLVSLPPDPDGAETAEASSDAPTPPAEGARPPFLKLVK